jgi:hypothetical protein
VHTQFVRFLHSGIRWQYSISVPLRPEKSANFIKVGTGTVHIDVVYLNEKAQENLKTHVQERLPEQYQKYINGLNQVLKMG